MSAPRAHQLPRGEFPPTTRGLAKYLQEAEGLEREQAVRIVRATFHFIKTMVLDHGLDFVIYKFGAFRRFESYRNTEPSLGVRMPRQWRMKFTASVNYGRIRLEDDDE